MEMLPMLPVLPIPMPNTNWELATLALATFSHWQHFHIGNIQQAVRPNLPMQVFSMN
jgi:hypothetical protein